MLLLCFVSEWGLGGKVPTVMGKCQRNKGLSVLVKTNRLAWCVKMPVRDTEGQYSGSVSYTHFTTEPIFWVTPNWVTPTSLRIGA